MEKELYAIRRVGFGGEIEYFNFCTEEWFSERCFDNFCVCNKDLAEYYVGRLGTGELVPFNVTLEVAKEKIAKPEESSKPFDANNMMMSVKYWPDGENEDEGGSPRIVQDVTSVKRDPRSGEFVIGTIFEDIRIPCKKYDTVIEVGA